MKKKNGLTDLVEESRDVQDTLRHYSNRTIQLREELEALLASCPIGLEYSVSFGHYASSGFKGLTGSQIREFGNWILENVPEDLGNGG